MIRNKITAFVLVGIFAILGAGALYAQTQQGGMMGMMSTMRDCPMMHAVAKGPAAALEHREELGLTAQQVKKLRVLDQGVEYARTQMPKQMREVHEQIHAATEGERFDEAAVRAALDRMSDLHADMAVAALRARYDTRQILTAEQRDKLDELSRGAMDMHGMMGGMDGMQRMGGMMSMMENCPMMQGSTGQGGMHGPMQHNEEGVR